ncbi:unnamed protein product [Enterobius vermicularis]|uniref:DUF663 domain-containing protein n=1 Tax=Enterobius vermicularis TaxID=51028 RepID=A0A0N4VD02_ENTVE|nr:unnamed protein product [Enterobius vermicularis]
MTAAFDLKKVKKEKKLWDEDDGKSTTVTDNCEKVAVSRSIKKEGEFQRKRRNRAFLTHMNYAEAKRLLLENPHSGLKLIDHKRHITIGWHQAGRVRVALKQIFEKSLNRFRHELKGVPLAIGPIKVPENATIIGTHSSMHLDVEVRVVVFRPKIGKVYKCTVTSVEEDYLLATKFGAITFVAPLNLEFAPTIGNEVHIRLSGISARGKICQMKGSLCNGKRPF